MATSGQWDAAEKWADKVAPRPRIPAIGIAAGTFVICALAALVALTLADVPDPLTHRYSYWTGAIFALPAYLISRAMERAHSRAFAKELDRITEGESAPTANNP